MSTQEDNFESYPHWRKQPLYRIEDLMAHLHEDVDGKENILDSALYFTTDNEDIEQLISNSDFFITTTSEDVIGDTISLTSKGHEYINKLEKALSYKPKLEKGKIGSCGIDEVWNIMQERKWLKGSKKVYTDNWDVQYMKDDLVSRTYNLGELAEQCSVDKPISTRYMATQLSTSGIEEGIEAKSISASFRAAELGKEIKTKKKAKPLVESFDLKILSDTCSWGDLQYTFKLKSPKSFAQYGISLPKINNIVKKCEITVRPRGMRI